MGTTESVYFPDGEEDLAKWIESRVDDGIFSSFSHGVRYCVKKTKENNTPEMV